MPRIIALYGHADSGKTATINYLRELLRIKGCSTVSNEHRHDDHNETFIVDGKRVVLTPGGDNEDIINSNIAYFERKHGDILVTATRSRGGSVNRLGDYARTIGIDIEWVRKSYEDELSDSTRTLCNRETAQVIYDRLYMS